MALKADSGYRTAVITSAIANIEPEEFERRAKKISRDHNFAEGKNVPFFLSGAELGGEHVFNYLQGRIEDLEALVEQTHRAASKALEVVGEESTPALMEILEVRNLCVRAADQAWSRFYATLEDNLENLFGVEAEYFKSDKELPIGPFLVELTQMAVGGDVHPFINWLYFWFRDESPAPHQVMGRLKLTTDFYKQAGGLRDPERAIREYAAWVRSNYKSIKQIVETEAKKYAMPNTEFNMAVSKLYGGAHGA